MKKIISLTSLILISIVSLLLLQAIAVAVPVLAAPNDWSAHTLFHARPASNAGLDPLTPSQIIGAYNLGSPTGGAGTTIAIVDAYDDPTIANDLATFISYFGLPAATFVEHKMAATISVDSGWALEISLDVEWAHAIAPQATILLVEAKSNSLTDLLAAVSYATSYTGVKAVSMSWGGSEFSTETSYDSHFATPGIVFFASSGDNGAGVIWPSSSPNVVGVGGTTLNLDSSGAVTSETAWSGSGGGVSAYEAKPTYQTNYGVTTARRAVPDVSYDADPNTGVLVYDSTLYQGSSGWWVVGGTSAGAPQWAAIQALGLSANNNNFYQDAKSASYSSYFRDITVGSNGYPATTGYDMVTGLGSALTTSYTPVTTPDFSISASPSAVTINAGAIGTSTITVTSLSGFGGTVSLTTPAPSGWTASPSPSSLTVASGGSNSSTLTITVPSGTAAGTYTVTVTGTNGSLSHSATVAVNVPTVPSAPQNLKATAGNAQVTLSWAAPLSNGGSAITGYKVYKGNTPGGETLLTTIGNVLTYTDTAVTNGQIFYYQVTAINSVGESSRSNEASATPSTAKTLSVTVVTDKATYSLGSYVYITVTVKDSTTGNPLRGVSVKVTVYYPSGSVASTGSGTTGSSGTVRFTYRVGRSAQSGPYEVAATVSLTGYQSGTGLTTFNVA